MGACNCSTETLDVNNRCRWRPTTRATKRGGRRAGIGAPGRTNTGPGNRKGNEESRAGGGGTSGDDRNQIGRQNNGGEKERKQTQSTGGARYGTHGRVNDGDSGEHGAGEDDTDEKSEQAGRRVGREVGT